MKKTDCSTVFLLIALFIFAQASTLLAAPASPTTFTVRQPDGITFQATQSGDEHQHWTETSTGHTIIQNKTSHHWEFANDQIVATELSSTGIRVGQNSSNAPSYIKKHHKPLRDFSGDTNDAIFRDRLLKNRQTPNPQYNQQNSAGIQNVSGTISTSKASPFSTSPVVGTKRLLVIMVNFTDATLTTTPSQWANQVFNTSAGVKSVANFYTDNSFGKVAITPISHTQAGNPSGVVTVTVPLPHPFGGVTPELTWVQSALNQASAYVNFALLDSNGDLMVEKGEALVYFVVAGYEQASTSLAPSVWAHSSTVISGTGPSVQGIFFPVWAMNGEKGPSSTQMTIGVMTHELGHQFAGLPDLYDTTMTNAGLGGFSTMASGSWGFIPGEEHGATPVALDAWSREYLGWSAPQIPAVNGMITLTSPLTATTQSLKLVNPALSSSDYFLVENRPPMNWDLGMAGLTGTITGGLLALHVDNTMGTNASGLSAHAAVAVVQALKPCDMALYSFCYGSQATLFSTSTASSLTATTSPNDNLWTGDSIRLNLTSITAPSAFVTAYYSIQLAYPSGTISAPAAVNTQTVMLSLNATTSAPDTVSYMAFSEDGVTYSTPEPYQTSRLYTLSSGDGLKNVWVRFINSAGTTSAAAFAPIILDTTPPVPTLSVSPALSGTITSVNTVTFSVTNADAISYKYSLDNSAYSVAIPKATATALTGIVNGVHTLAVVASDTIGNWTPSTTATKVSWTVNTNSGVTSASPAAGSYVGKQTITLTNSTPGSVIYYSTTGVASKTSTKYTVPIVLSASATISYMSVTTAGVLEVAKSSAYVLDTVASVSTISPLSGSFSTPPTVTLSTTKVGATIYYTTDGTTPTTASKKYTTPFATTGTTTVRYFSVDSGLNTETGKIAIFTVVAPKITISVSSTIGVVPPANNVIITGVFVDGVQYKYSLNGSNVSAPATMATPIVLTNSAAGTYTLYFYILDTRGVWSTVPKTVQFVI